MGTTMGLPAAAACFSAVSKCCVRLRRPLFAEPPLIASMRSSHTAVEMLCKATRTRREKGQRFNSSFQLQVQCCWRVLYAPLGCVICMCSTQRNDGRLDVSWHAIRNRCTSSVLAAMSELDQLQST